MNFIIFDLEATCWQGKPPGLTQEIIEIGALLVSDYGEVLDEFNRFIKPELHPVLSAFCQELTTITQAQIERADRFPEVIEEFLEWAHIGYEDHLLCSWGAFDIKMLRADSAYHCLDDGWTDAHINLKEQYRRLYHLPKAIGLKKAVRREGFDFEGTHHRAIDDARNLALIFSKHLDAWQY